MASLRNAMKTNKAHRERHQPQERAHLGLLEKKKDYQQRSRDFNEKKEALKLLHKRALNRNPDEFYHHMVRSAIEDGEHVEKPKEEEATEEQVRLMQTQDFKYIGHKRLVESRKIDKLRSGLHLLDAERRNGHVFFVDTPHEAKTLDVAQRLATHPALLGRTANRPRLDQLKAMDLDAGAADGQSQPAWAEERQKSYRQLEKRVARERQLLVAQQKMQVKRLLQNKKEEKPKRIVPGTKSTAPVYRWKTERKR